jgi:DNA-binding PadR family transcriptional regulator
MPQPTLQIPILKAVQDRPGSTSQELVTYLHETCRPHRTRSSGQAVAWDYHVVVACLYNMVRRSYVVTEGERGRRGRASHKRYTLTEPGRTYLEEHLATFTGSLPNSPEINVAWQKVVDTAHISLVLDEVQRAEHSNAKMPIDVEHHQKMLALGAERGVTPTPNHIEAIWPELAAAYAELQAHSKEIDDGLAEAVALGYFEMVGPDEYQITEAGKREARRLIIEAGMDPDNLP